jgi:hypothetical protein
MAESDWQTESTENATAEEARLLYVGFTRARDYLILPTTKNGAPWLDRAFARGGGTVPVLSPDTTDAPFDWNGKEVNKSLQTWTEPRHLPSAQLQYTPVPFITGLRPGRKTYKDQFVSEDWLLKHYPDREVADRLTYYTPTPPDPANDERLLGQCIANFQQGKPHERPDDLALERAAGLVRSYLPGGEVLPDEMLEQNRAFFQWMDQTYPGADLLQRVSMDYRTAEKRVTISPDWIVALNAEEVAVVVNVYQTGKQFEQQLPVYLAHLALTQDAVKGLMGKVVREAWLHVPVIGGMFRMA